MMGSSRGLTDYGNAQVDGQKLAMWGDLTLRALAPCLPALAINLVAAGLLGLTGQGRDIIVSLISADITASAGAGRWWGQVLLAASFAILLGLTSYAVSIRMAYFHQDGNSGRSPGPDGYHRAATATAIIPLLTPLFFVAQSIFFETESRFRPAVWSFGIVMLLTLIATFWLARLLRYRLAREHAIHFAQTYFVVGVRTAWLTAAIFLFLFSISGILFVSGIEYVNDIGSLAILFIATSIMIGFFYTLSIIPRVVLVLPLKRFAPYILLIFLLFLFSIIIPSIGAFSPSLYREFQAMDENHHVRIFSEDSAPQTLDIHARSWIAARCGAAAGGGCEGDTRIPAFVVLAEGGGMRAAQHAAVTLDELNALSGGAFLEQVAVLSGVSGGAIGIAAHLAGAATGCPARAEAAREEMFRTDHLAVLIGTGFYVDLPSLLTPLLPAVLKRLDVQDFNRAFHFERSFHRAWSRGFEQASEADCGSPETASALEWPLDELAERASAGPAGPIVLFSATRAEDGELGVVANVSFETASGPDQQSSGVHAILDFARTPNCERADMSAITAAHLSARFPWINPPGVLELVGRSPCDRHHRSSLARYSYVDGAFIDNSGAAAARPAVAALHRAAFELGVEGLLDIRVIHIFSRPAPGIEGEKSGSALSLSMTPLAAAVNARQTRGRLQTVSLCRLIALEAGRADLAERCETLHAFRDGAALAQSAAADADDGDLIRAFDPHADGAPLWINAPLQTSTNPQSDRYAPLGWLLTPASRAYVKEEAEVIARAVYATLSDGDARQNAARGDASVLPEETRR